MKTYNIKTNGSKTKEARLPDGRHEVTLEQWNKAYEYLDMAIKANDLLEEEKNEESQLLAIESMCGTMASLSRNLNKYDLMHMNKDKVNNLFLIQFAWLSNERHKREFNVNGKKFLIPNFAKGTCGDFMDAVSLLSSYGEHEDSEKGLVVAAIYMRQGEYYQDIEEINERMEFLKKYGRMDLFSSAAFFLLSSLRNHKIDMRQHSNLKKEMEKLTSTLNAWATILYSQASQNRAFFRTP